jgi:threonine dehydratase
MFMTVTDAQAETAMRILADGAAGDIPIVSGESGAAGLAALQALVDNTEMRQKLGLDAGSRVVLFNTEGATAPGVYKSIVGRDADTVLTAQSNWLEQNGISEGTLMARVH